MDLWTSGAFVFLTPEKQISTCFSQQSGSPIVWYSSIQLFYALLFVLMKLMHSLLYRER